MGGIIPLFKEFHLLLFKVDDHIFHSFCFYSIPVKVGPLYKVIVNSSMISDYLSTKS